MNYINRHNYETFFLLYIDNELPLAEKMAVEEFVEANPDLEEELVILQQSILKPDNIVLDDKSKLFKIQWLPDEIIPAALQEKLLLHLDNELTDTEKEELNELIKADDAIKNEWDVLQQTKLLPGNTPVFEDKQSLYKKEPARVIGFAWRRVAVAAVFIGFVAWGGWVYFNNGIKIADRGIAAVTPAKASHNTVEPVIKLRVGPVVTGGKKEIEVAVMPVNIKRTSTAAIKQSHEKIISRRLINRDILPAVTATTNNLPAPYFDNLNKIEGNETIPAYVTREKQSNSIVDPGNNPVGRNTISQGAGNVYASATSYTDNSEENNNRVLFMDEEKIKKTKLGGIFRKVKRVLERNTNIKSGGNNIKVANLEFAIQ